MRLFYDIKISQTIEEESDVIPQQPAATERTPVRSPSPIPPQAPQMGIGQPGGFGRKVTPLEVLEVTQKGTLVIKMGYSINVPNVVAFFKTIPFRERDYDHNTYRWAFFAPTFERIEEIEQKLSENGFDTSGFVSIKNRLSPPTSQPQQSQPQSQPQSQQTVKQDEKSSGKSEIVVKNIAKETNGKWLIGFSRAAYRVGEINPAKPNEPPFRSFDKAQKEVLQEVVDFSFPGLLLPVFSVLENGRLIIRIGKSHKQVSPALDTISMKHANPGYLPRPQSGGFSKKYSNRSWVFLNPGPHLLVEITGILSNNGFDTSSFESIMSQFPVTVDSKGEPVKIVDSEGHRIPLKSTYTDHNGETKETTLAAVRGDYDDMIRVHNTLKTYGFNTKDYDAICRELIDAGYLKRGRLDGDLPGFQTIKKVRDGAGNIVEVPKNDRQGFDDHLKKTYDGPINKNGKIVNLELYDEQRKGIAFLYGRESAILGDETGTGKTLQMVVSANERMKQSGGRTIIITLPNIVGQWAKEIISVTRCNESDVGFDPWDHGAKWIVLSYTDFSAGKKENIEIKLKQLDTIVDSGDIKICILDEVHRAKNPDAQWTQRILAITNKIPTVWGGTATIVANTPIDVYTQLQIINHKLGKLSYFVFASELSGMKVGPRRGLKPGTPEEQAIAANKLKEWLVNYGVYIQRGKEDIREDMPEHIIDDVSEQIDPSIISSYFADKVRQHRLRGKKFPPITAMQYMRESLAYAKAPKSAAIAAQMLDKGEKVAVFTTFKAAGDALVLQMQQHLDRTVGGRVVRFSGGMNPKVKEKIISDFKDLNSDARAMVISIRAGGTGMDFPNVTSHVFVNDYDWSPSSAEQSEGRFFRISSQSDVKTTYILAKGTVDEEYFARVKRKREIADKIRKLTKEQMELISRGRRAGDKELEEKKKQVVDAIKEQAKVDEEDQKFEDETGSKLKEMGDQASRTASRNWFGIFKYSLPKI